jgi:PAS domain S-box-containing protein
MKNLIKYKEISSSELCGRMAKYKGAIDRDMIKLLDEINLKLKKMGKDTRRSVTNEVSENFSELLCRTLQGDPTTKDTIRAVVKDLIWRKIPISFAETFFIFGPKAAIFPYLQKEFSDSYYGFFGAQKKLDDALRRIWVTTIDEYYEQTMETLKESEEKFKNIFDNASDGILPVDPITKKFAMANNTICRMLGYTENELKKLTIIDITPKKDLPRALGEFKKQARNKGGLTSNDIPLQRKNGSIFYADINSTPVKFGGKPYLVGIFRDITERRKAEDALKESEEHFRAIFDNAGDGILVADMKTKKFVMVNRKICRMLGYTESEMKKLDVSKIHPKKDLPKVLKVFKLQAQKKLTVAKSLPMLRKDKTVFYADVSATPFMVNGKMQMAGFFRPST